MRREWLLAGTCWVLLSSPTRAQNQESPAAAETALSRVEALCPDALRESEELQSRLKRPSVSADVSRPALRAELLLLARQDQEARAFLLGSGRPLDPDSPAVQWMGQIDSRNLRRLKHIVHQDGFPTAAQVGLDGVDAAWLMTIHASSDPDFQQQVLALTVRHVQRGEVRGDQVAMLTDDLLVGRGKPQRYGTNFDMRDGELKPTPMENEADIEELRKSVGLGSMKNYSCLIRAMYDAADPQAPATAPSHE